MKKPELWGPSGWNFIHHVTAEYPEKPTQLDKQRYGIFFNNLRFVLPCSACRQHYTDLLRLYPIHYDLSSRHSLMIWGWIIHNEVNKRLSKKNFSWNDFKKKYVENNYAFQMSYVSYLLIGIILIVVIYTIIKSK